MTQNPTPRRGEHGQGTRKTEEETQKRSTSDATSEQETRPTPERRKPEHNVMRRSGNVEERREPGKEPPEIRADE